MAFPAHRVPAPEDPLTLTSVKRHIHFVIVRIGNVVLEEDCQLLDELVENNELSGFKINYQIPGPKRSNLTLHKQICVNTSRWAPTNGESIREIFFDGKKVISIEMDNDLINCWNSSSVQITLALQSSRYSKATQRKDEVSRVIARCSVHLSHLLVPPFIISQDFPIASSEFRGSISIGIELASRQRKISEQIQDARKLILDSTFTVTERPARRTRARSTSRCHSEDQRRSPSSEHRRPSSTGSSHLRLPRISSYPTTSTSSTHYSHSAPTIKETPILPERPIPRPPLTSYDLHRNHQNRMLSPSKSYNGLTRKPVILDADSQDENDSVFETETRSSSVQGSSRISGALNLEMTLHEARNLPLVPDRNGCMVPPRAFIQMLARNETIMSTVASQSCNPRWNWTGEFVVSSERGNLVVKILHKEDDEKTGVIGILTLNAPLMSFEKSEFEISPLLTRAAVPPTITLSLRVQSRPPSVGSLPAAKEYVFAENQEYHSRVRSQPSRISETYDDGSVVRWIGDSRRPHLELTTRRRSRSRHASPVPVAVPPVPVPRQARAPPLEDRSHRLNDDLVELMRTMNSLGH